MDFLDELDVVNVLYSEAIERRGEDSHYAGYCNTAALIGVFDGCGGLGSRQYDSYQKNTGAYMASHVLSAALKDWFDSGSYNDCENGKELADSIDVYFRRNLKMCVQNASGFLKLKGSMVRDFPSTAAVAFARKEEEKTQVHLFWAGDSRVYCLNSHGLKQLSEDDAEGDAFESLLNGAPMTNVISSDGKYTLHSRTLTVDEPVTFIAASDGAYAYVHTPMDFEYLITNAIDKSDTPYKARSLLYEELHSRAADDMTFAYMCFGYGSFDALRDSLKERVKYLETEYIQSLEKERNDLSLAAVLWEKYKKEYEEKLHEGGLNE